MSDRPVECGECKRAVKIIYKEIVGQTMTCTEMCAECPVFKTKLHGTSFTTSSNSLSCKICGTFLETVQMGQPLGCPNCYEVFSDSITEELIAASGIPSAQKKKVESQRVKALHIGAPPGQLPSKNVSSKLAQLNESLQEALKQENYEEAALLRDQIKKITDADG